MVHMLGSIIFSNICYSYNIYCTHSSHYIESFCCFKRNKNHFGMLSKHRLYKEDSLIKFYFSYAGISVDGDLQGVPRILDALSAHMWPGLVMKSPVKLTDVVPPVSNENDEGVDHASHTIRIMFIFS